LYTLTRLGILVLLIAMASLVHVQAADTKAWSPEPFSVTSLQQAFDFDVTIHPPSAAIMGGGNATFSVEAKTKAGIPELVKLSATGLPPDWNASFYPESGIPQPVFSSTLTIMTSPSTPVGTYILTILATSRELIRTGTITLVLLAAPADFALSLSPESRSVVQGESTTYTLTLTVIGSFSQPVLLAPEGLPIGVNGRLEPRTFHPTPGRMSQTSTLYVSTNSTVTPGEYEISVVATTGGLTRSAMSKLVVLYSDPFRQAWQIIENLPDVVKGGTIGGAAVIIAAIIGAYASRRKRGTQTSDEGT
jgi:hypothetical protein